MVETYRTLAAEVRAEPDKIQGSRHIGTAAPVADEREAFALLERVAAEFRGANHHAWAWRLGPEGENARCSDDGEPGGSAGPPILKKLEASGLTQVMVVVTRFFGGTKLGVGGLIRAYGGAAAEVLAAGAVVDIVPTRQAVVVHDHADSGPIFAVLNQLRLSPGEACYGERVRQPVEVPLATVDALVQAVRDATSGRGSVELDT